jgi:hypothetical protein
MKHADNCAPTLLKFQDELIQQVDSALGTKKESKADVRWLKLETNHKKVSHTQSIQL